MKIKTNNTTIWFWFLYVGSGLAMLLVGLFGKFEGDKLFVLVGAVQSGFGALSGLFLITRFINLVIYARRNEVR